MTAKGRRELDEIHALNEELNAALQEGFTAEELKTVLRFLNHVRAATQCCWPSYIGWSRGRYLRGQLA